jgi:hypothetical protein
MWNVSTRAGKYWMPTAATAHLERHDPAHTTNEDAACVTYYMERGYNTNYATSWFLVSGGPQTAEHGWQWSRMEQGSRQDQVAPRHHRTAASEPGRAELSPHVDDRPGVRLECRRHQRGRAENDIGKYGKAGRTHLRVLQRRPGQEPADTWTTWLKWDGLTSEPIVDGRRDESNHLQPVR